MPSRPSPKSLQYNCYQFIALNFEKICYGLPRGTKELLTLINTDQYKEVSSPFREWPSILLEELAEYISRYRSGAKFILYQIIQPQITSYEIYLNGSIHIAINLLSERCKRLKKLSFRENINLPSHYFTQFFKHFEYLLYLDISGSMVDDNGFFSIAMYSPQLTELYACRTYLTDIGIRYMTISEEDGEIRLKHLQIMDVRENRVSPAGLSIFLDFHNSIQSISYEDTFAIFNETHFSTNIQMLSSTNYPLTSSILEKGAHLCPFTRELCITNIGMSFLSNEDLLPLMGLEHLTCLHLGNSRNANPNLNFSEGVEPLLSSPLGQNIQKLELENFTEIDIYFIYSNLPNLKHLALSRFISLPINVDLADVNSQKDFPKLKNIQLWNENKVWIHPNVYKLLIINSGDSLEKLILRRTQSLKDNDLIHIVEECKGLQVALLDECPSITVTSLLLFLQIPNELSILRCWGCEQISSRDAERIRSLKKQNNFNFSWDWHPYYPPQEEYEVDGEELEEELN